jgi:hypothetical protein
MNIEDIINKEIIDKTISMHSNDKIFNYNVTSHVNHKKIYHIMWHILHSFSTQYPEIPTEDEKNRVKNFLSKFKQNMPFFCASCSNNKKDVFVQNYDLDLAVSSKINLVQFFCDYHIEINTKYRNSKEFYNPDIYNANFIINKYSDNSYSKFIESKYNINLFNLFINNDMDSFLTLFNEKTIKAIRDEKFGVTINIFKEI